MPTRTLAPISYSCKESRALLSISPACRCWQFLADLLFSAAAASFEHSPQRGPSVPSVVERGGSPWQAAPQALQWCSPGTATSQTTHCLRLGPATASAGLASSSIGADGGEGGGGSGDCCCDAGDGGPADDGDCGRAGWLSASAPNASLSSPSVRRTRRTDCGSLVSLRSRWGRQPKVASYGVLPMPLFTYERKVFVTLGGTHPASVNI